MLKATNQKQKETVKKARVEEDWQAAKDVWDKFSQVCCFRDKGLSEEKAEPKKAGEQPAYSKIDPSVPKPTYPR